MLSNHASAERERTLRGCMKSSSMPRACRIDDREQLVRSRFQLPENMAKCGRGLMPLTAGPHRLYWRAAVRVPEGRTGPGGCGHGNRRL